MYGASLTQLQSGGDRGCPQDKAEPTRHMDHRLTLDARCLPGLFTAWALAQLRYCGAEFIYHAAG